MVPEKPVAGQGGDGARCRVVGRVADRLRPEQGSRQGQAGGAPPRRRRRWSLPKSIQKTVPIYSEFVAQTDAKETVEIRARVQAFLEAQHFTEGTVVKKDQLLFTLDKREYEAKLLQAKAELDVAPWRDSARPKPTSGA